MRILFVLNQLPYPPRNGVTIPSYNYLKGMAEYNEVYLLFLRDTWYESSDEGIEKNRRLVAKMWVMDVHKQPALERIGRELKGVSLFHVGRAYDESLIREICESASFDVVWVSDDGILDVIDVIGRYARAPFKSVAGINDCITSVFEQAKKQITLKGGTFKGRVLALIKWLRSFRTGAIEEQILSKYDFVLVQSALDERRLCQISRHRLAPKIVVASNGVDEKLFQNEFDVTSKELVFVGSLRGYSPIVEWLLDEVWLHVRESHPDVIFHIIGKGASAGLLKKISTAPSVKYTDYVEDICDVYKGKALSISPVFKNYGLINKVVESMAAGIPVVADKGSFSCIPEFDNGTHGLIANDAKGMITAINKLLSSGELRQEIGRSSRVLIQKHFRWKDRIDLMRERLGQ